MALLEVKNIQKSFGKTEVLKGISFGLEKGEVLELINPRIIAWTGHQEEREGCLSLPGKWALTNRPKAVTVRALNRHGEEIEVRGEDLLCRALCHEIDHLDGKLFTDVAVGKVYRQ